MKILPHSLRQGQERAREKSACKKKPPSLELEQILLSDTNLQYKRSLRVQVAKGF